MKASKQVGNYSDDAQHIIDRQHSALILMSMILDDVRRGYSRLSDELDRIIQQAIDNAGTGPELAERLEQETWIGVDMATGKAARAQQSGEGRVAIPRDVAEAHGMYLIGYSWLKHNAPNEINLPADKPEGEWVSFQQRVQPWLMECFGEMIDGDREERNHRFLEEALELVQSCGCTADEAHKLVDYVYGRAVGDPPQEVGGVLVTLAALCLANEMDMHKCGEVELGRITQPAMVEKIREKQKRKPSMSPLPGIYSGRSSAPDMGGEK